MNLLDNPLLQWAIERLRSDRRTFFSLGIFAILAYGLIGCTLLFGLLATIRRAGWWEELLTVVHYEAWVVNGIVLLLWAPARLAQNLAQERQRGTLDMLRLTGLSDVEMALGHAGGALLLPLCMVGLTIPVILLGLGNEGGPSVVVRGYLNLLILAPVYVLAAGIVGLSVKKAQNAGSSAVFTCLACLTLSGLTMAPRGLELKAFGLLGPWGAGLASTRPDLFQVEFLAWTIPGDLLQIPVLVLLGRALLAGLARRLSGEPGVLLGRTGALALGIAVAVAAALTFSGGIEHRVGYTTRSASYARAALTGRFIVIFLALLLLAAELPLTWRALVRGLARRDRDDPLLSEERLNPGRFLSGILVVGAAALVMGATLAFLGTTSGARALVSSLVAAGVVGCAWLAVCLAVQAALLGTRDQGAPRALAAVGVGVVWFAPLGASWGLRELGAPAAIYEFPLAANPFYAIAAACHHGKGSFTASGLDPLALGIACAGFYALASFALVQFILRARQHALDTADSLVALPADAYADPGTLTQRCPRGHLYAETWSRCPHCPPEPNQVAASG